MRFRLSKEAVVHVFSLIEQSITTSTSRNYAVKPMDRLLLTLRYYATGSFLSVVGNFTGVSKASACRIVKLITHAIAQLRSQFIFPTNKDELQEDFYEIARFPRVIAAIDCTHIPIKSPGCDSGTCMCSIDNIAIDMGDQQFDDDYIQEESNDREQDHSTTQITQDNSVRNNIINDNFASLIR
ncbi:hypothetical protein evm_007461 [Chilo suppressalis]|nr:hypothetical protein evm_007461 [Chilo suppressalis]